MPVKPKKIPLRMCVACREMKPKRDLMRLVRPPEDEEQGGKLLFDKRGKMPGRGAYLCRDYACLEKAIKAKALELGATTLKKAGLEKVRLGQTTPEELLRVVEWGRE